MVRALALQARGHWFESSCFHQNNRGFSLGFLLPSTALCAALRRAPFGRTRDKSLLTLAQTAPAVSTPPLCVHAPPFGSVCSHSLSTPPLLPPFCSRCSVAPLLTSPVVSTKTTEGFPSVFCCLQQPSARHCAARLSAETVTSHCSRSRKPHPTVSAPPLCVHAPPFGSVRLHPHSTRPPSSPVLLSLFRRSAPYESSCFHQNNRGFPSVFCCPQQTSARHCAARLSAEPVTSHCSRSRKPHPPSPRFLFAFTLRRSAPFVCALFHTPHLLPREMPVSGFDRKIRAKWR